MREIVRRLEQVGQKRSILKGAQDQNLGTFGLGSLLLWCEGSCGCRKIYGVSRPAML